MEPSSPADQPDVAYAGDYPDFAAARAASTGYDAAAIVERTRSALLKVVRGEAAFERDSVTFDQLERPGPVLDLLLQAAAENGGHLSVLDFGGALGSTYFHCRSFLAGAKTLEWSIVEQPAHVACGRRDFANEQLRFYATIAECLAERRPTVLLLSGVLQYLPEPWTFLHDAATPGFQHIIIDRLAVIDAPRDRLTVEVVAPRIYPASYPAWFLSRPNLPARLPAGWKIQQEFDALDRQLLDGIELTFKGYALQRCS